MQGEAPAEALALHGQYPQLVARLCAGIAGKAAHPQAGAAQRLIISAGDERQFAAFVRRGHGSQRKAPAQLRKIVEHEAAEDLHRA